MKFAYNKEHFCSDGFPWNPTISGAAGQCLFELPSCLTNTAYSKYAPLLKPTASFPLACLLLLKRITGRYELQELNNFRSIVWSVRICDFFLSKYANIRVDQVKECATIDYELKDLRIYLTENNSEECYLVFYTLRSVKQWSKSVKRETYQFKCNIICSLSRTAWLIPARIGRIVFNPSSVYLYYVFITHFKSKYLSYIYLKIACGSSAKTNKTVCDSEFQSYICETWWNT